MDAKPTTFSTMLSEKMQFLVPLYQRPYSWRKKEWRQLWDDIVRLSENSRPQSKHFIGPMVIVIQETSAVRIPEHLVIDGQQRLITILVLLAAIRDKDPNNPEIKGEITKFLTNQHKPEPFYFKLWPTQDDREIFSTIIKGVNPIEPPNRGSKIFEAYKFFEGQISRALQDESLTLDELLAIIERRLNFVLIELTTHENAHVIFESLNAKGAPLTQADLIRNYFFMKVPKEDQNRVHDDFWKPIEAKLKKGAEKKLSATTGGRKRTTEEKDYLTDFIRNFLMREGMSVDKSEVYLQLRESVETPGTEPSMEAENTVIDYLKTLGNFAENYAKLLWPDREPNAKIARRISRLNRLEVTVAYYPFLLNVYDSYSKNEISVDEFVEILSALENFVVRRTVCKIPPNSLSKIFGALIKETTNRGLTKEIVANFLSKKDYPPDNLFKLRFPSFDLYVKGSNTRAKVILECIEESYGHKETVLVNEQITIEHVLPQNPDATWWRSHLGEECDRIRETWLHTIGNLTLTGYNSEESDKSYPEKRKYFESSNFELTKDLARFDDWTEDTIQQRANAITARCVEKVWPNLNPNMKSEKEEKQRAKSPCAFTIFNERFIVRGWASVIHKTLEALAILDSELFDQVKEEFKTYVKKTKGKMPNPKPLPNGYWVTGQWKREHAEIFCDRLVQFLDIQDEWSVEYELDADAEEPALAGNAGI